MKSASSAADPIATHHAAHSWVDSHSAAGRGASDQYVNASCRMFGPVYQRQLVYRIFVMPLRRKLNAMKSCASVIGQQSPSSAAHIANMKIVGTVRPPIVMKSPAASSESSGAK